MIAILAVILLTILLLLTDYEEEQREKIKVLRQKSSKPLWLLTIQDRAERRRQEMNKGRL